MPAYRATVTAVVDVALGERGPDWRAKLAAWASADGWERTLDVEASDDADRCTITEVFAVEAPTAEEARQSAWRAFGARAFDAGLPPGPERLDIEVSPLQGEGERLS